MNKSKTYIILYRFESGYSPFVQKISQTVSNLYYFKTKNSPKKFMQKYNLKSTQCKIIESNKFNIEKLCYLWDKDVKVIKFVVEENFENLPKF